MVERDLAKVEAAGASPVSRSKRNTKRWYPIGYHLFCVFEPRRDSKVRGLRFAPVVAKRTSTGRSATSRALINRGIHLDIIFVFPILPGLEGSRSPLRSGRCKATVHWTFCSLRSPPVVVTRMSAGHSTTSRALISRGIRFGHHFVFLIPLWFEGSRSLLRFATSRALKAT